MGWFTEKHASRKFIDLIKTACTKWANWDPAISIEPGDYGSIDRETGKFQVEGNIFHEPQITDIVSKYSVKTGPLAKDYIINSLNVREARVAANVHVDVLNTAEVAFGGQWSFGRKRGALLVLYGMRIKMLPDELLEELMGTEWAHGRNIVTNIHSCPAYALYLSSRYNDTISIRLLGNVPLEPGVDVGGEFDATWAASDVSGIFQKGCVKESVFVPLFQIREIKKRKGRRRQSPSPDDDKEDWVPIQVPWDILDENGAELPDKSERADNDDDDYDSSEVE